MAELIAEQADFDTMNIQAIYVIGSVQQGNAGPASDLDLLIHTDGNARQRELIRIWIDGWSKSLAEINYERTGYKAKDGLIDLHLVSSEDFSRNKSSFATMIGSLDNSATLLKKAN